MGVCNPVAAIHPDTGERHEWPSQRHVAREHDWSEAGISGLLEKTDGDPVAFGAILFRAKRVAGCNHKPVRGWPSMTALAKAAGVSRPYVSKAYKAGTIYRILERVK